MRRSLDQFFSESARRHPHRPALVVGGENYSYAELDAQCQRIERAILAISLGGKGRNIGLLYGRSVFTYAAIIAIMRTDNVYVPLNPKLPRERLTRIIEDARIEALVLDPGESLSEGMKGALMDCETLHIITTESVRSLEPTQPAFGLEESRSLPEASLAYIIYTSGSTGIPKGVAITHDSAYACIEKSHRLFETHAEDRFTQFSALSFDVSILDLFLCWKSGAALHVPDASEALVPLSFAVNHGITVWSSVPSLANILLKLRLLKPNVLPQLRLVLFCGEALPCELAEACLIAAPSAKVINLYGPTECTIFATYYQYEKQEAPGHGMVPIGTALPGLRVMVVDDGRPVEADNVPGELWISGDQLAAGYWKNPSATKAAFVPDPLGDTRARWYRTGDLVSQRAEVGLEFRGRLDRQVKLRGHRIELQEIEAVLRDVIPCTLVAVVPIRDAGGICEEIVAFCDRLPESEGALKTRCLGRLPRYMVPDRLLELETFPFTSSGKVDYRSLAAMVPKRAL